MKFSVMSRKAKPTARPKIDATPRIDITTWVRPNAPSASKSPPMIRSELMTEPRTDLSRTLPTNGASTISALAEKMRHDRQGRHDAQRQEDEKPLPSKIAPECLQLKASDLYGRHHLLVGVHLVQDHAHTLHALDDVGDLIARVVIGDTALE